MILALAVSLIGNAALLIWSWWLVKQWELSNEHWKDANTAWGESLDREKALAERLKPFEGLPR